MAAIADSLSVPHVFFNIFPIPKTTYFSTWCIHWRDRVATWRENQEKSVCKMHGHVQKSLLKMHQCSCWHRGIFHFILCSVTHICLELAVVWESLYNVCNVQLFSGQFLWP